MNSLARKLAISTSVGSVIAYGLCAVVFFYLSLCFILSQFDATLEAKAQSLVSMVSWDQGFLEFDFADELMPEFGEGEEEAYFQMWLEGDQVFDRSDSLDGQDLVLPTKRLGLADEQVIWNLNLDPENEEASYRDDDVRPRRGRAILVKFHAIHDADEEEEPEDKSNPKEGEVRLEAPEDVEVWLMMVVDLSPTWMSVDRVLYMFAGMGISLAALIYPISVISVRTGMTVLQRMNRDIAAIDVDHLDARVETVGLPRELQSTAIRINEFVAHMQSAVERERRFTSGAAHELRTPLAEMRSVAEVAIAHTNDVAQLKDAMEEVVGASEDMEGLLEVLLKMARAPHLTVDALSMEDVDVDSMLSKQIERKQRVANERNLRIVFEDYETPQTVCTDRRIVSAVFCNLLTNAIRYAPQSSVIKVLLSSHGGSTQIVVTNGAKELSEQDMQQLFEPFWRKDQSRSMPGTGLGLSVARSLAEAIGGRLEATLDQSVISMWLTINHQD